MLLNDRERAEAVADVARLILSSGQTARVLRVVPGERLYGTDDAEYAEVSVIPLELNETPPAAKSTRSPASFRMPMSGVKTAWPQTGKPIAYRAWRKNTSSAPSLTRTCNW